MSLIAAIRRTGSTYVKAAKAGHMPAVPMETTLRNYATYFQPWPKRQARFLMQGTTRGFATASEGYLSTPPAKKVGLAHLTLAAYEAYVQEVRARSFPAPAHARRMDPGEARALFAQLGMDLEAPSPAVSQESPAQESPAQESRARAPSQVLTLMRGRRKSMRAMSTAAAAGEHTVLGTKAELRAWRRGLKGTVALVPTMGNLHAAHLSLVDLAAQQADHVVVSIFVNPLQFAAHEDLDTYPRSLAQDLAALPPGVTVFAPAPAEMYPAGGPDGGAGTVVVPRQVEGLSEAACRPHFFSGVATVCLKLFNLVQPDAVVFGEKDAMQCSVIRRMLRDLDLDIRLVVGPTGRTAEGVAMSSRNSYLTPAMWKKAPAINKALEGAAASLGKGGTPAEVRAAVRAELEQAGMTVQYISVADGDMAELEALPAGGPVCLSVACLLREGEKQVRLLDCKHLELG